MLTLYNVKVRCFMKLRVLEILKGKEQNEVLVVYANGTELSEFQ